MTDVDRCTACDGPLSPGARFCARCGAAVGSPPTREELLARAERARAEARARSGAAGPSTHGPSTHELPRVDPAGEPVDHAPEPVDHAAEPVDEAPVTGTFTAGRVAAMVATFVLLTVLGTWTLSQLFGSAPGGAPDPTGAATAGSTTSPSPSASASPSGRAPADSAPEPRLADAPQRCSTSGSDEVATTWSGNRDTSCAFSDAVRAAYREAGAPDGSDPFRTYSTVTKKWYDVTCLATQADPPVRCHSADGNAVVFLGP